MKSLLTVLLASITCISTAHATTAPVNNVPAVPAASTPAQKQVCVDVLDNKTNKKVKKCKSMKIHKKHNGIIVPKKSK